MTRNRVKYWADTRGWSPAEIYREAILKRVSIGKTTIERLYAEPEYTASVKSLEALAKIFGIRTTEMIEDVPDSGI